MAIAQVEDVRDLDRHRPRHPLVRNVPLVARRFESILQDGYDPAGIKVLSGTSLLAYVSGKTGYTATRASYSHPLWEHLAERVPAWSRRETWLATQLSRHGILRVEPVDEWNANELGLMPGVDPYWGPTRPPPLNLQASRFVSLDGLLLLLLLYREAQDAAHTDRAERLEATLYQAASEWARLHRYRGEALDTWEFLTESRMVAWTPRFQPSTEALQLACQDLLSEQALAGESKRSRKSLLPEQLKPGTRSERRWRRRAWIRACCRRYNRLGQNANYEYRDTSPVFEWVVANRASIAAHRSRAIDVLMDDEGPIAELAPLAMPEDLYRHRRRPLMTEEEWVAFGDRSVYDVIPVVKA
jgi:hypothetical protein